jgi:hypothetical protein
MKRRFLLGLLVSVPLLLVGENLRMTYNRPADAAGATTITSGLDGRNFLSEAASHQNAVAAECVCTCGGRCERGGCWCIGRCWCIDECDACKEGCCPTACEVEGCPIQ